MFNMEMRNQLV